MAQKTRRSTKKASELPTVYTLAAYPEGRECVVALNARVSNEVDREAIENLVNTVEVDCERVTSGPLPASSTSASVSASPEASAPDSGSASPSTGTSPCPHWRWTPDGWQCSNLPDVMPPPPSAGQPPGVEE